MSKLWSPQMTDLALAGAVTVLLPVVVFVAWPLIARQMAAAPRGAVLIYEVDPDSLPEGVKVEMQQLIGAVDRRVNAGSEKLARVQGLDDRRIEVALIRPDEGDTQRVEKLLTRTATLEFRILANTRHDKALDRSRTGRSLENAASRPERQVARLVGAGESRTGRLSQRLLRHRTTHEEAGKTPNHGSPRRQRRP